MDALGRFPTTRLRRNRRDAWTRRLVSENALFTDDLIWPIFLMEGAGRESAVESMPGVVRVTVDRVAEHVEPAVRLGIPAVALFPMTPRDKKDEEGTEAANPDNLICQAARLLKREFPDTGLLGDVALDLYTTHGHDGVLREGEIANDESAAVLVRQALVQARAGIDVVAPSDMMDGRVGAIRRALDEHGFEHVPVLSYAAKYASAFYGPFREAADSAPQFGDRRTYQMDPPNVREALREIALDLEEGADAVMVKPALAYLDVIRAARERFDVPLAAYNVSGEYAMVKAAAARGWLDERTAALESLTAIKRAGADIVISYWAKDVASWVE